LKLFNPKSTYYQNFPINFNYEAIFDVQLVQPGFQFDDYPNDAQDILIRYAIVNYDAAELQLFPLDLTCSYLSNGKCSFSTNPLWTWDQNGSTCNVYYDKKDMIWPAYTEFSVRVNRQGSGLIVRLILPITLLLLLSGLTFWTAYENRVDITITLMLSVSALYIVILANIPMVGYLTTVDRFVFYVSILFSVLFA